MKKYLFVLLMKDGSMEIMSADSFEEAKKLIRKQNNEKRLYVDHWFALE